MRVPNFKIQEYMDFENNTQQYIISKAGVFSVLLEIFLYFILITQNTLKMISKFLLLVWNSFFYS